MFFGFAKSYTLFPIHSMLKVNDMSQGFIEMVASCFWSGIQLSFPFMIVFLVMQIAFGVMNRMIPQLQVFFVSLPFQLWSGLIIFMITCSAILMNFGQKFEYEFKTFFMLR